MWTWRIVIWFTREAFSKLIVLEEKLVLDLDQQTLGKQCYLVKDLLICENYFLRFHKWRISANFLIRTDSKKNQVKRDLSACTTEKFTRYSIVRSKYKNKERVSLFTLIGIISDPTLWKKTRKLRSTAMHIHILICI